MPTLQDAQEAARAVVQAAEPIAVIAFGSTATKGEGHDVDLLVVVEREEVEKTVQLALRPFYNRFAIDCFTTSIDRLSYHFKRGSPFLRLVQREGKLLYMKDFINQWIRLSKEDLDQASYLLKGGYYRGACFHSQQAAEKALKARLLEKGWELEKTHSIRRLLAIAEPYRIGISVDEEDMDFMDSIYRGRYPADEGLLPLRPPTKEDAERALSAAQEVLKQLGFF